MFEQIPYTNFHELNMDWIIKVVKDFLAKIEDLENTIATGKEDIINLTTEELQALTDKKVELEALLQEWYDTHSADIANALRDAIQDFDIHANQKAQETIATIPSDYTEVANQINTSQGLMKGAVITPTTIRGFINETSKMPQESSSGSYRVKTIDVESCNRIFIRNWHNNVGGSYYAWAFYDSGNNFICGKLNTVYSEFEDISLNVPTIAKWCRITTHMEDSFFTGIYYPDDMNLVKYSVLGHSDYDATRKTISFAFDFTDNNINLVLQSEDFRYFSFNYYLAIYNADGTRHSIPHQRVDVQQISDIMAFSVYPFETLESGQYFKLIISKWIDNQTQYSNVIYASKTPVRYGNTWLVKKGDFNPLNDKRIAFLGDSLTDWHTSNNEQQSWPYIVCAKNRAICYNLAIGGSSIARPGQAGAPTAMVDRVLDVPESADIVFLMGMANDFNYSIPISDIDSTDPYTFCGALNTIIDWLHENRPKAKLIFCNGYRRDPGYYDEPYADALINVCKKRGVPHVDNYHGANVYFFSSAWMGIYGRSGNSTGTPGQGMLDRHLNSEGEKMISTYYEGILKSL